MSDCAFGWRFTYTMQRKVSAVCMCPVHRHLYVFAPNVFFACCRIVHYTYTLQLIKHTTLVVDVVLQTFLSFGKRNRASWNTQRIPHNGWPGGSLSCFFIWTKSDEQIFYLFDRCVGWKWFDFRTSLTCWYREPIPPFRLHTAHIDNLLRSCRSTRFNFMQINTKTGLLFFGSLTISVNRRSVCTNVINAKQIQLCALLVASTLIPTQREAIVNVRAQHYNCVNAKTAQAHTYSWRI